MCYLSKKSYYGDYIYIYQHYMYIESQPSTRVPSHNWCCRSWCSWSTSPGQATLGGLCEQILSQLSESIFDTWSTQGVGRIPWMCWQMRAFCPMVLYTQMFAIIFWGTNHCQQSNYMKSTFWGSPMVKYEAQINWGYPSTSYCRVKWTSSLHYGQWSVHHGCESIPLPAAVRCFSQKGIAINNTLWKQIAWWVGSFTLLFIWSCPHIFHVWLFHSIPNHEHII